MSIFSRFFGRNEESADSAALLANPDIAQPLSLQVLFAEPLAITEAALADALRAYHPTMAKARAEIAPDMPEFLGMAGWDKHVVRLVGFNAPYPKDALEACVAPSHYPAAMKDEVRAHGS